MHIFAGKWFRVDPLEGGVSNAYFGRSQKGWIITVCLDAYLARLSTVKVVFLYSLRALYLKCSSVQLYVGTNTFFILFCHQLCIVDFCILHQQCCLENQLQSSKMIP